VFGNEMDFCLRHKKIQADTTTTADISGLVCILICFVMRSCWSYLTAAAVTSSSFFVADAKLYNEIYIEFGANLGDTIPSRLRNFFGGIPEIIVKEYSADMEESLGSNSLVLSFGDTQLSQTYASIASVNSEGYHLSVSNYLSNSTLLAVNGQPIDSKDRKFALDINKVHYGAAIGSYAALEMLGFSFLHPLQPYVPSNLSLNEVTDDDSVSKIEEPYWEKRTWHIHTMHPLEFTEVLNGYDIPMFVNFDQEDFKCPLDTHCESWESMYENLPGVFDWLLANKQNRVEVLLLGNEKWDNYDDLTTGVKRQDRLRKINDLAHEFGLLMGADIPIALMQQHGWAMVQVRDDFEKQKQDIIERVGWAFNANYDFITTESGLSEFTKPSCDLMLDLFEVYIKEVVDTWGREAMTKVHCSTDQYCTDQDEATGAYKYTDPRTGEPINFNFLPTYASNGLGVLTHTVQVYSFDDPTAGAYGNDNFTYMSDYMNYEASLKKRDVLYYGETAYWVNVDVDVPLFLPLSGQRRLADLRQTARLETKGNYKISGQMNFESGWEFGYYISNVVCARAAWNPMMTEEDEWIAFEQILAPALSVFGEHRDEIIGAIVNLAKDQAEILIFGRINGRESADLTKLSGHAYMSGSDTWVDLPRLLGLSFTQPDKVHVDEPNDPLWNEAREMLAELKTIFTKHSTIFQNVLTRAKDSLDPVRSPSLSSPHCR
jgi:hypothetical protein